MVADNKMVKAIIKNCVIQAAILPILMIAGPKAPKPLDAVIDQSDLVVFATVETTAEDSPVRIHLTPSVALKGKYSSATLAVTLRVDSTAATQGALGPAPKPGTSGLWFLRGNGESPGYVVVPLVEGGDNWRDAFLLMDSSEWPLSAGSLQQQALQAIVALYLDPKPNRAKIDNSEILVNLQHAGREQCQLLAETLIAAADKEHHLIGIAASIMCGSDSSLQLLSTDLETLRHERSFPMILNAIGWHYTPQASSSIGALAELIALRSDALGFDDAIASALVRINRKLGASDSKTIILPVMAQLLDSRDPTAQLRASSFFATFSIFADANGDVSKDQRTGPFYTEATRAATPQKNSGRTPADYATFWRSWWLENRSKFEMK